MVAHAFSNAARRRRRRLSLAHPFSCSRNPNGMEREGLREVMLGPVLTVVGDENVDRDNQNDIDDDEGLVMVMVMVMIS